MMGARVTGGLWLLFLELNAGTFCLYGVDKRRARRGEWRISERTLLLFTWLMGGIGAFLGMRVFRHKTKHLAFQISAPAAALLSLAIMLAASVWLLSC